MKKIFTLFSAAALGVISMSAAVPMQSNLHQDGFSAKYYEASKQLSADVKANNLVKYENLGTRGYVDQAGNYWTAQFLTTGQHIAELYTWRDDKGNIMEAPTFEQEPALSSYVVWLVLQREGAQNSQGIANEDLGIQYCLVWPSYFLWSQQFQDKSLLDGNGNPVDFSKCNVEIVPFEELTNSGSYCRTFVETGDQNPIPNYNSTGTNIQSLSLINVGGIVTNPNTLKNTKLTTGYTKGAVASVEFFSTDGDYVNMDATFAGCEQLSDNTLGNTVFNLPVLYDGSARVDGFDEKNIVWPELGGIHVFDCGVVTQKTEGRIWSGDMEDLHKYIIWGYDKYLKFGIQSGDTNDKVIPSLSNADDIPSNVDMADHLNYFRATVYTAPNQGPEKNIWKMTEPSIAHDDYFGDYPEYAPTANCIIPYIAATTDAPQGCQDFGYILIYKNFNYNPSESATIGLGTTDGFQSFSWDDYNNYTTITYNGTVTFHNDPNNPNATTTFESTGDLELSAIEEIIANENVAPVYFNLQGVRVANPENGMFIEVRGKVARKVVIK